MTTLLYLRREPGQGLTRQKANANRDRTSEQIQSTNAKRTPEQIQSTNVKRTPEQIQSTNVKRTPEQIQSTNVKRTPEQIQSTNAKRTPEQIQSMNAKRAEENRCSTADTSPLAECPLTTGLALRVHGPFKDVMPQHPETLREYNASPVFLKPHHCMLCEQEFDCQEQLNAHTQVEHQEIQCRCGDRFPDEVALRQHLLLHDQDGVSLEHGARDDMPTYRQKVFAQAISDWPIAATAQVHRTRLYAMKALASTLNCGFSACACCAMEKKNKDQARVLAVWKLGGLARRFG